jgi:hypothetical protein
MEAHCLDGLHELGVVDRFADEAQGPLIIGQETIFIVHRRSHDDYGAAPERRHRVSVRWSAGRIGSASERSASETRGHAHETLACC